jgi:hypothetical protein
MIFTTWSKLGWVKGALSSRAVRIQSFLFGKKGNKDFMQIKRKRNNHADNAAELKWR